MKRTGKESKHSLSSFLETANALALQTLTSRGGFTSSSHSFMCGLNYFLLQLPDSYVSQLNEGQESQVIQIEGTVFIFTLKAYNENRKSLF